METKDILKNLGHLCQVDIDAVASYEQAIDNVTDANIKQKLEHFKNDHERHITEISKHIRTHGGQPPEYKPGMKGFVLKGFTAIRSAAGTEAALNAMKSNEYTTNKHYSEAMNWDWPDEIMNVVKNNYDDEKHHLDYIESTLRDRPWETQPRP